MAITYSSISIRIVLQGFLVILFPYLISSLAFNISPDLTTDLTGASAVYSFATTTTSYLFLYLFKILLEWHPELL